ncbi:substrate-binding domain-containing protein [Microbispora sp. H10836]|uniref:sugar ABC transporter substrate-binding protein n=1 Tax=Microbispora sp. H10836 TaxID=2729106 RepID=UPI001474DF4D|nr:substrate-binding domain-containing protein [Microbispora sp. H10836]
MKHNSTRVTMTLRAAVALLAVGLVTSCASTADDNKGGDASETRSSASRPTAAGAFMEELAKGYESGVPTKGPAPAKGKSVWWISCGESIPDCSVPAAAAGEAAKTMGIKFNIADGKLNVGGGNAAAIRTALAAGPDAIILHGMSCSTVQQPLTEARDAGVLVMGVEGLDCSDEPGGGQSLFSVKMKYSDSAPTVIDYFRSWGVLGAKYLAGATGGKAKVIHNAGVEPLQKVVSDAFIQELGNCKGCEIVDTVEHGSPDYGPNGAWIQQFRTALAKNPTANATYLWADALLSFSGGVQAVKDSGLDMVTAGGVGGAVGMDLVREGKLDAVTGAHDVKWIGYAAMDNINRALNGEDTVPQGVGSVVVDAQHNLPEKAGSDYASAIDWKSAYEKLWSGQ